MSLTKIKRNTYLLILCSLPVLYFLYDYTPFDQLPESFKFNKEWHVEIATSPKCPETKTLYLIKTAPYNFKLRKYARQLHISKANNMLFIIGQRKKNSKNEELLKSEIATYNDFIIGDFIDSYDNLTMKTLTGYTYFAQQCKTPKWLIFADDDTVIEKDTLNQYIDSLPDTNRPHCLGGLLHWNSGVIRSSDWFRKVLFYDTWEKYQVTKKQYSLSTYPPYCGGPCCLVSSQFANIIQNQAEFSNPGSFTMEDVLFTGILRVKSNLKPPVNVHGICTHYNHDDKEQRIKAHVKELLN